MSSDDYHIQNQVQNIYRYSRKTYKKVRRHDDTSPREESPNINIEPESARSDRGTDWYHAGHVDIAACSCDTDPEAEIASILHKKCPVISLAQQQLQRLLDGTDRILYENTRRCRSVYDFMCICKDLVTSQNKAQCALCVLICVAFLVGLLLGAASCGSKLGRLESPILSCIDDYFVPDTFPTIQESFRSIV
ncbi:hypothetical protein NE865_05975 [Phthorimaea operculella]|nr:hypothetical protein NE865_05975 [Phthorimaea operculella]